MNYDVVCACGHTIKVDLFGKGSDRESKLRWMEGRLCPECARAEDEKKSREAGLPLLTGSEKQIAWANSIRLKMVHGFEKIKTDLNPKVVEDLLSLGVTPENLYNQIVSMESAHWWIDRKDSSTEEIVREAYEKIKKDRTQEISKIEGNDAVAEATIYPKAKRHDIVPEIKVVNECVLLSSPRDDNLRAIVKDNGYTWESPYWKRKITAFNGNADDRAAELGNILLNAGFGVQIQNPEIREKAVSGGFTPECKRWIYQRERGSNILSICFEKGAEDVYNASRKIPGSRWSSPCVEVPLNQADAILEFGRIYGFSLTERAKVSIDAYKKSILIVEPAAENKTEISNPEERLKGILSSSREVLPELRDDE